jgi:hypothetical protein
MQTESVVQTAAPASNRNPSCSSSPTETQLAALLDNRQPAHGSVKWKGTSSLWGAGKRRECREACVLVDPRGALPGAERMKNNSPGEPGPPSCPAGAKIVGSYRIRIQPA